MNSHGRHVTKAFHCNSVYTQITCTLSSTPILVYRCKYSQFTIGVQSYAYALTTSPHGAHARRMLVGFLSCFCRIPFLPAAARLSTHAAGSPYFLVSSSLAVLSHSP